MDRRVRCCTENLLVSVTICFVAGASAAYCFAQPLAEQPLLLFVALVPLTLIVLALGLGSRLRPLSALPFFFLVGLLHTHQALQPISDPNHITSIISGPTKVTLIGRILTMVENNGERTRFELDCESMLPHDASKKSQVRTVHGKVLLSVLGSIDPQFLPGKTIMAIATVDRIRNYQTPGAFNYRLQMATKALFSSGWIQSPRELMLVEEPFRSAWRTLFSIPEQIRQHTADFLNTHFDSQTAGFYQALLIGSMVNVPPQLMEAFKENGCFHVLSILCIFGIYSIMLNYRLNSQRDQNEMLQLHPF